MYILGGETVSREQLKTLLQTLLLIGAMLMICGVFCLWRYWGRAEQVVTARELDYHIEIELDSLKQCRLKKRYKNNEAGQDELQGLTPKGGGDCGCE